MTEQLPPPAVEAIARDLGALIAEAETLRALVAAARPLHRAAGSFMGPSTCARDHEVWPCATIVALGGPDVPKAAQ
jgi:hypothetical protein